MKNGSTMVSRAPDGRWLPGAVPNPAGRPLSARTRIAEAIIRDIAAEWERSGAQVLERMARDEPSKFATLAAGLIPREGARRMVCQLRQSPAEGTIMGGLPRKHRWRAFKFPILWSFWSRSF
jgi:hypothetical protein